MHQHFCAMKDRVRTLYFSPPWPELPLHWTGCGEETRCLPGYRHQGHRHGPDEYILWQFTLSGRGQIEIAGGPPVTVGPSQGFLARLPSDHVYYHRAGDPAWHFIWAMWSGPAARGLWESLNKTDVRIISGRPPGPEVARLRLLIRGRASGLPSTPADSAEAYRLLLDLCRPGPTPAPLRRGAALLPRLEKTVRRRPTAPIGKDGLAASLDISRFQLYRAMRRETGLGPKEWTARRRVDQACRLLRGTRQPVAEIAVAVGLPDANYFARFFRKQTGFTPSAWRRVFALS